MYDFAILENKSSLKIILYKLLTIISLFFSDTYSVSSQTELENLNKESSKYLLK